MEFNCLEFKNFNSNSMFAIKHTYKMSGIQLTLLLGGRRSYISLAFFLKSRRNLPGGKAIYLSDTEDNCFLRPTANGNFTLSSAWNICREIDLYCFLGLWGDNLIQSNDWPWFGIYLIKGSPLMIL